MIFEIKKIPDGHSEMQQDVQLTDEQRKLSGIADAVRCRAFIDAIASQIHVRIEYTADVMLTCARCLKQYKTHVSGEYRVIVRDASDSEAVSDDSDDESTDFVYTPEDTEIDTRHALFEEISLAMPLMPLCDEACAGVADKNNFPNADDAIDPRWEALKKLKLK